MRQKLLAGNPRELAEGLRQLREQVLVAQGFFVGVLVQVHVRGTVGGLLAPPTVAVLQYVLGGVAVAGLQGF